MSVGEVISDYASALRFLLERINYERTTQIPYQSTEFKLDRMRELLRRLGDPQLRVPVVHVAGTKGKGSTSAMLAAILQKAGYRTGLYTSPHLNRVEERFAIDGQLCSESEFVELARAVEPIVRELDESPAYQAIRNPTFFEITTAMAMLHFAQRPVDISVLEVGLGGRLDSTNVCQPAVTIITSISFDHMRQLGNTLAAIAREKAGIIKPSVPCISGVVAPEPQEVIRATVRETGAPLYELNDRFEVQVVAQPGDRLVGPTISYRDRLEDAAWQLEDLELGLLGRHQADNAACAIAAVRVLRRQGWNIADTAIREGLREVRWPARVEVVRERPTVVVDAAHNPASIAALVEALRPASAMRRVLIFAASRDKEPAAMLEILLPHFDQVVLTQYVNNPRASEPEQLLAMAKERGTRHDASSLHLAADPESAWRLAQSLAGDDGLVCITGSFFLAAELRPMVGTRE